MAIALLEWLFGPGGNSCCLASAGRWTAEKLLPTGRESLGWSEPDDAVTAPSLTVQPVRGSQPQPPKWPRDEIGPPKTGRQRTPWPQQPPRLAPKGWPWPWPGPALEGIPSSPRVQKTQHPCCGPKPTRPNPEPAPRPLWSHRAHPPKPARPAPQDFYPNDPNEAEDHRAGYLLESGFQAPLPSPPQRLRVAPAGLTLQAWIPAFEPAHSTLCCGLRRNRQERRQTSTGSREPKRCSMRSPQPNPTPLPDE